LNTLPDILLVSSRYAPSQFNSLFACSYGRYSESDILNLEVICDFNGKANAIGRSSKTVREFLEKNHKDDLTREESIKLTVKSLLEVVQTGAKNIEISVMESYGKVTVSIYS